MNTKSITNIPIDRIITDNALQMRADGIDIDFADTLADVLQADQQAQLNPVTAFSDEREDGLWYFLGDGNHRNTAYKFAGRKSIPAVVCPGGRDAAWRFALGANADQQAKPRTRKDARKAVQEAIMHCIFSKPKKERLSQVEIAEICKVNQSTVSRIYKELSKSSVSTGKDGKSYPAAKAPEQLDFYGILSKEWAVVDKQLEYLSRMPVLADETVSPEERVRGIQLMREALKRRDQELRNLEGAIASTIQRKGA